MKEKNIVLVDQSRWLRRHIKNVLKIDENWGKARARKHEGIEYFFGIFYFDITMTLGKTN